MREGERALAAPQLLRGSMVKPEVQVGRAREEAEDQQVDYSSFFI